MHSATATKLTNPFVGLRAFEEHEDYLFFGRSAQINELLKILSQSRFLAVIGASGSGKSSLVKSGLLPAIYSGFMTVGSNWRAVSMRPGEDPIGYLTKALATEDVLYGDIKESDLPYELLIEASLRRSENGLVQVYKDAHLPPKENLLIVVDQFEELFRFSRYEKENNFGKSDAMHFIQILLAAAQQKEVPIYVLLTMRADFLGDCAEFRGLPEAINEAQYLVPRMKRDEIREAITGPVAVSGATTSQRLVTRLLNDLNNDTDQLPILQHALMRTWDAWFQRNQHDTPIDLEDYEKIGTMRSALSLHADEVYAELSPQTEQRTCELMFKALTDKAADVRGIRRPRSIADLTVLTNSSSAEVQHVADVFRRTGRTFLMPPPSVPLADHSVIDISHESLMRVWTRLTKWIEEEARSGDIYLRLANAAQLKEQGQRGLYKNPELEIALRWKEKTNPIPEWAEGYKANYAQAMSFLEESHQEDLAEKEVIRKRLENRKRLVIGAVVFLLIVATILASLWRKAADETEKAQRAEAAAQQSAIVALAAKKQDSISRVRADSLRGVALLEKANAISAKKDADSNAKRADSSAKVAREKENEAQRNADSATVQKGIALAEKKKAETLLEKTLAQNLKIAANEYARLIREGPSVENQNSDKFYDKNYFLVYAYHFGRLDSLIKDSGDKASYASLRNKLYYNNDLYRRIYDDLGEKNRKEAITDDVPVSAPDFYSKQLEGGGNVSLEKTNGRRNTVTLTNAGRSLHFTLSRKDAEFLALAASRKSGPVFCSTNDNLIYVFNNRLEPVDTINMGAKVTALHYFDARNKSIIYFGTASGYIGYINFGIDKKNQPVFENKLETEIKAVELFPNGKDEFLLAAAAGSSPRVYKLDDHSLTPDKLLLGNELPYKKKDYGTITGATYDPNRKCILLFTNGKTYAWNPFSRDLLERLKKAKQFRPESADSSAVEKLRYYSR